MNPNIHVRLRPTTTILLKLMLTSCMAMLIVHPAAAEDNVTGVWFMKLPTGDGNFIKMYFDLQQSGERVTGAAWYDYNKRPVMEGSFRDGRLHLKFLLWQAEPPALGYADGTAEAGELHLRVRLAGDVDGSGVAARTTREALALPARLPVPELQDVRDNGLARTPPMGWNSWNKFAQKVDDKTVREMADAVVSSGMRDAGYVYVNIDDTWEGQRDAQGNITGNLKFPDMKALTDYVHSKGLKIGIYSSPGPYTCGGYEGSYGHEAQDAKTYAAWGFDYLKYDWCSAGRIYKDEDMQAVYQKMGDALQSTGRPIVFSLCQYGLADVWKWGTLVGGNSWRTTGDITDGWKRMAEIGFKQFDIANYIRAGHWNDPDMLEVGNGGMTADEYRTHMSLWCLLAAPLLAGNDLRTMNDDTKSILMNGEVIAIDQDPEAKPARKITDQGAAFTAIRHLKNNVWAVGLFNRGDAATKVSIAWADLGLHGSLHVRDLWAHKDLGKQEDGFTADVPRHGVVLITAKK